MIREASIIIKGDWLIFTKDWINLHLGKTPWKGGRPANDKKDASKVNFIKYEWEIILNIKVKIYQKNKRSIKKSSNKY